MALERLDGDEKMTLSSTEGHSGQRGGAQFLSAVNEPGLYSKHVDEEDKNSVAIRDGIPGNPIQMI